MARTFNIDAVDADGGRHVLRVTVEQAEYENSLSGGKIRDDLQSRVDMLDGTPLNVVAKGVYESLDGSFKLTSDHPNAP